MAGDMKGFIKKTFFRGLAALLPTILTVAILWWIFNFLNKTAGTLISTGLIKAFELAGADISGYENAWWMRVTVFLIAFLLIIIVGFILFTFIGSRIYRIFEGLLQRIPVIKQVYPYAKQVVDFFFREKKVSYGGVVGVEYPRKGIYTLGFLTGEGIRELAEASHLDLVNIFIPSSPTPVTGYTIFVAKKDIIPLTLTIEEALRLVVSGGVLVPESQKVKREHAEKVKVIQARYLKRLRKIDAKRVYGTK